MWGIPQATIRIHAALALTRCFVGFGHLCDDFRRYGTESNRAECSHIRTSSKAAPRATDFEYKQRGPCDAHSACSLISMQITDQVFAWRKLLINKGRAHRFAPPFWRCATLALDAITPPLTVPNWHCKPSPSSTREPSQITAATRHSASAMRAQW